MVRYELLRDIPGVLAGTTYVSCGSRYYGPLAGTELDGSGKQDNEILERDILRLPGWFRPIPEEPPVPKPLYPVLNAGPDIVVVHSFQEPGFSYSFRAASDADMHRLVRLLRALYTVFGNRRNVECGSVPFSERDGSYGRDLGQVDCGWDWKARYAWPTREMAQAEADFWKVLFENK